MSEQEYLQLVALLDKVRADIVAGDPAHELHVPDYCAIAEARDVVARLRLWRKCEATYGDWQSSYLAPLPLVTPESIRA